MRDNNTIAVSVIIWSSKATTVIPWRLIENKEDVIYFVNKLRSIKRSFAENTVVANAYKETQKLFDNKPCSETNELMVDISTDDEIYENLETLARNVLQERCIRINALFDWEFNNSYSSK